MIKYFKILPVYPKEWRERDTLFIYLNPNSLLAESNLIQTNGTLDCQLQYYDKSPVLRIFCKVEVR